MVLVNKLAFTLVELLIVIALIAILSVAVLATINPIEQSNKAKDAAVQNDAAELMNALERYYAANASYPWVDIDSGATVTSVDSGWFGNSQKTGAGLCTGTIGTTPNNDCNIYDNPGLLILTDELKNSFLEKGYTSLMAGDPGYSAAKTNLLWVDKKDSATGYNSIYICFIPKAKINRTATTALYSLYAPTVVAGEVVGLTKATQGEFVNGSPDPVKWDFTSAPRSLFKCVP